MTTRYEYYFAKALELLFKAEAEADPEKRARLETLAARFRKLAEAQEGLTIEFELPPIPCTIRLRDVLERMTDAELALQPGEIADQERERCRRKPCSTS